MPGFDDIRAEQALDSMFKGTPAFEDKPAYYYLELFKNKNIADPDFTPDDERWEPDFDGGMELHAQYFIYDAGERRAQLLDVDLYEDSESPSGCSWNCDVYGADLETGKVVAVDGFCFWGYPDATYLVGEIPLGETTVVIPFDAEIDRGGWDYDSKVFVPGTMSTEYLKSLSQLACRLYSTPTFDRAAQRDILRQALSLDEETCGAALDSREERSAAKANSLEALAADTKTASLASNPKTTSIPTRETER